MAEFPAPTLPGAACSGCDGAGVTGQMYRWQVQPHDRPLLVEVLCPTCGGCGRAEHDDDTCDAPEHPGYDDDVDEGLDDEPDRCRSCWGVGWFTVQGWSTGADGRPVDDSVTVLRMPCGCAAYRLVDATTHDGEQP